MPDFVIDNQPKEMETSFVMHAPRNADLFDEEFEDQPEVVVVEETGANESFQSANTYLENKETLGASALFD